MKLILKKNGSELDVTNKVQSRTLTITLTLDDYSASFDLNMTTEELRKNILYIGMDVQIFDDKGKRIFGGIIERLTNTYLSKDVTRVRVEISNYNILAGRFVIIDSVDVEADRSNTAGNLAKKYILANLSSEGVTAGQVRGGIQLSVIENFESVVHLKKLSQLMDELCTTSGGYYWSIDINKKFNFYSTEFLEQTTHSSDNLIVRPNSIFRDVQFKQDLVNYNNTIYAIGGMADPGTPTANIDSTGRVVVKAEYTNEVTLMSSLNGGNGIWANVFQNDSLTSLSELQRFANDLLAQHGERPSTLSFETSERLFEAGDYIFAELGMYFAGKEKFAVDEVMIEHMGKEDYIYYYTCSLRSTNTPKTVSLGTSLKNAMKKEAKKEIDKENGKNGDCECCCCDDDNNTGEGEETPPVEEIVEFPSVTSWIDPSDASTINLDANGNFASITDKVRVQTGVVPTPKYVYLKTGISSPTLRTVGDTNALYFNNGNSSMLGNLTQGKDYYVFRIVGDSFTGEPFIWDGEEIMRVGERENMIMTYEYSLLTAPGIPFDPRQWDKFNAQCYINNGKKTSTRTVTGGVGDDLSRKLTPEVFDIRAADKVLVSGNFDLRNSSTPIEILEVIHCRSDLITPTEELKIRSYLMQKHGIV